MEIPSIGGDECPCTPTLTGLRSARVSLLPRWFSPQQREMTPLPTGEAVVDRVPESAIPVDSVVQVHSAGAGRVGRVDDPRGQRPPGTRRSVRLDVMRTKGPHGLSDFNSVILIRKDHRLLESSRCLLLRRAPANRAPDGDRHPAGEPLLRLFCLTGLHPGLRALAVAGRWRPKPQQSVWRTPQHSGPQQCVGWEGGREISLQKRAALFPRVYPGRDYR